MADNKFPRLPYQNNMDAVTFHQRSAENLALTVQTYRFARLVLQSKIKGGLYANPCVVMDLDETVLDNSDYQAWLVATGRNFHEATTWKAWCRLKHARAIPGAIGFIRFATDTLKVPVFFITSRVNADCRQETLENLISLGVPISPGEASESDLTTNRLFMKGMTGLRYPGQGGPAFDLKDKFSQRVFLETTRGFEIILSIGDNLADYADYYGGQARADGRKRHDTWQQRRGHAEQDQGLWGTEFILIPNAVYGGWLRSLYDNGIGDTSELSTDGKAVRGLLEDSQQTRLDQLSHSLPEDEMKRLVPEME